MLAAEVAVTFACFRGYSSPLPLLTHKVIVGSQIEGTVSEYARAKVGNTRQVFEHGQYL